MKSLILTSLLMVSAFAIANEEKSFCNHRHLNLIERAEGPKKDIVEEIMSRETPNFSCEVTTKRFMFPMDCGRFTFTEYHFNIDVAATNLKFVVRDGGVSCTAEKRTELLKVKVTR